MTRPPTKTPASNATVPPTVAREFATRRSSCGTSRGTTAAAVDRKNRFTDMMRSAPAKNGIAWSIGSKSTSPTSAAFTHGANSRIRRRRHRSMKTPDERPEDRIGEGDDERRLEEPGGGVLLLRGEEHHRGHESGLEEPVGGLAHEPDREELAEVGARESPTDPFQRARPGVHRTVRLSGGYASADWTSKNRVQS